ncbi:expressed unknown protein [Seminavis robusta]|uniref:Uncharacterized protein n=1 Tax=Seminavis robusta TaxID=568900 RepID=A0A9N8DWC6_9STRA|nr:expressed unknown protein [Seminavis robusta]|eukprot:Sro426_g140260.1 n/a (136) ;mRNA; r:5091-5498
MKFFQHLHLAPLAFVMLLQMIPLVSGFSPRTMISTTTTPSLTERFPRGVPDSSSTRLFNGKISKKRKAELGIPDGADEYDLYEALRNNTDDTISKVVAGSFIVVMIALLVAGIVVPSLTDYGEGVCNPILTAGRC